MRDPSDGTLDPSPFFANLNAAGLVTLRTKIIRDLVPRPPKCSHHTPPTKGLIPRLSILIWTIATNLEEMVAIRDPSALIHQLSLCRKH